MLAKETRILLVFNYLCFIGIVGGLSYVVYDFLHWTYKLEAIMSSWEGSIQTIGNLATKEHTLNAAFVQNVKEQVATFERGVFALSAQDSSFLEKYDSLMTQNITLHEQLNGRMHFEVKGMTRAQAQEAADAAKATLDECIKKVEICSEKLTNVHKEYIGSISSKILPKAFTFIASLGALSLLGVLTYKFLSIGATVA